MEANTDGEYDKKFSEMVKYIPFLEAMIARLNKAKVQEPSRELQLIKMRQLHGILTSNKRKLKLETLQKCEGVLQKLWSKVGKGAGGLNFPPKKNDNLPEPSIDAAGPSENPENSQDSKHQPIHITPIKKIKKKMDETPASPSPPASPDLVGESTAVPIIIPTERKHDYSNEKIDSKPASPEPFETISTSEPIIIPTERKDDEHSKKSINLFSPPKSGMRKYSSSEKIFSAILEKDLGNTDSNFDSNKSTESLSPSKKSTPLLLPPKPETSGPPLSMEDLAELLDENTGGDKKAGQLDKDKQKSKEKPVTENKKLGNDKNDSKKETIVVDLSNDDDERRWEEVDKHIVKMTSRKLFPPGSKADNIKSDSKPPFNNSKRYSEKNMSGPPGGKNTDRFSDNYERYPRHSRDFHNSESKKNSFRHSDGHQQRGMGPSNHIGPPEADFRRDNDYCRDNPDFRRSDFYDHHNQAPHHHSSNSGNGYLNPQWPTQNSNMRGHPNASYQNTNNMPIHQDQGHMWNMGSNMQSVDDYPPHHIQNRFNSGPMRPPRSNPDINFADDIPLSPPPVSHSPQSIPPLMSVSAMYPGPSYPPHPSYGAENHTFDPPPPPPPPPQIFEQAPQFDRPNEFPHGPPRPQAPPFDRPNEFTHGPQQWEPLPNRPNDNMPYERPGDYPRHQWDPPPNRPSDPPPFVDRQDYQHVPSRQQSWEQVNNLPPEPNFHEASRGRGIDNCYNRPANTEGTNWCRGGNVAAEVPPGRGRNIDRFSGDRNRCSDPPHGYNRRSEWDRSPNDPPNRFGNRDPRFQRQEQSSQPSNTDSRGRTEQSAISPSNMSNSPSIRRDPRLSKDHNSAVITIQTKDLSPVQRDPRRRNSDSKEPNKCTSPNITPQIVKSKIPEKAKDLPPNIGKPKGSPSTDNKLNIEKVKNSDTMHSPLESLYGVIDTTAKTGKGYGLQKFKIPKIKRPDAVPRPPTPPKSNAWREEDDWKVNSKSTSSSSPSESKSTKHSEEKKIEVTSTTNETNDNNDGVSSSDNLNDAKNTDIKNDAIKKEVTSIVDSDGSDKEISELKADTSTPSCADKKRQESPILKNAVTEELIESLVKKSLESLKLFPSKKYKKIQRIINSESESSSSDDKKVVESKKKILKKKKAIVSDSSEEESLEARIQQMTAKALSADKTKKKKSVIKKEEPTEKSDSDAKKDNDEKEDEEKAKETVKKTEKSPPKKKKPVKKGKSKAKKVEEKVEEKEETVPEEPETKEETKEPTPTPEEKQPEKKPRKTRRRNSLEMLQEDIREMFISDAVVTATGQRTCTQKIKEPEKSVGDGDDKIFKSVYVTSSPERYSQSDNEEDGDSRSRSRSRARSRSIVRGRSRARSQSQADSEGGSTGNQRSKTPEVRKSNKRGGRGGRRGPQKRIRNLSKEIISSSDDEDLSTSKKNRANSSNQSPDTAKNKSDKPTSPTPDENLDDSMSSLRRSGRVAMKEPRVLIEKTELTKIDSSKIMFDTSSDESFGIDVSGLTAAVDISLHSERKASESIVEPSTVPAKKNPPKGRKSRKQNLKEANVRKTATPVMFDDEVSMASDNSVSSSNTSSIKKVLNIPAPVDNNEELITNIIGSLGDGGNDGTAKEGSKEKEKEAENKKDDAKEKVADKPAAVKKPPVKRKKRNIWQSGRVKIYKKKKPVETPVVAKCTTDVEEKTNADESKNNSINDSIDKNKSISEVNKSLPKSEIKEVAYPKLTVEELIEYAWTGQERYKCLLCSFAGKNIVHHYKSSHPKNENMISRLTFLDAKRAIDESKDEVFTKLSEKLNSGLYRKFTCRFCIFVSEGLKDNAMELFYEHCTTHTGEYRYTCKTCEYQATSKSAIKTHYYKMCRKFWDNVLHSFSEDDIPAEEYVPGYLCSLCNLIQLKEENAKNHVSKLHAGDANVDIIKINMSSFSDVNRTEVFAEHLEDAMKVDMDVAFPEEENITNVEDLEDPLENIQPDKDSNLEANKSDVNQDDVNDNSASKKLSAFVCPPDLDNKEQEIQLERQKKMQEILNNIGRKLHKDTLSKGLSIIDKLKNKMTTLDAQPEATSSMNIDKDNQRAIFHEPTIIQIRSINQPEIEVEDPLSLSTHPGDASEWKLGREVPVRKIADDANAEKLEKKLKDPLATVSSDNQKNSQSETEISDTEPMAELRPSFQSEESSDDMSDTEIPTDVNLLLKDAETIKTSTKVPMMTTIQRLAAQLQGVKSFTSATNDGAEAESHKESADASPVNICTKVPVITSVGSLIRVWPKSSKVGYTEDQPQDGDSPRNFIRLRRLSGDKLSLSTGEPLPEGVTDESVIITADSTNAVKLSLDPTPPLSEENPDDSCSFLKIENVVSLAPTSNEKTTSNENSLINDIRKAVGSPEVIPMNVTVVKKTTPPTIVKKMKSLEPFEGLVSRLPPTSAKVAVPANSKNFKLVKVVRGLTVLKPKENLQMNAAPRIKTSDAYQNMLVALKLRDLYKCMGRTCVFSTDSIQTYSKHYANHLQTKPPADEPYDFQKCPYCSDSFVSVEFMKAHYKKKHTYCSFQCSYCFYRAFTQSYVELHQGISHPGKPLSVILGKRDHHPMEVIDRREYVLPFVCKHECDKLFYVPEAFIAHLNNKHEPPLSIFKCHSCPHHSLTAKHLVSHYKLHGIYKYQCLFCLFGADAARELHHHLSSMHCNRPPKILERSLPPMPMRDKDVLLQLIIKNLDESYKCTELKVIADSQQDPQVQHVVQQQTASKQPIKIRPKPMGMTITRTTTLPNPIPITTQVSGPIKLVSHSEFIDIIEKEPRRITAPISSIIVTPNDITVKGASTFKETRGITLLTPSESSVEQVATEVAKVKDKSSAPNSRTQSPKVDSTSFQIINHGKDIELRYTAEQTKAKVANAADPSVTDDDLRCDEEFININILDNPELLKGIETLPIAKHKQQPVKRVLDKPNPIDLADKDDDSDIEILECIQPAKKNPTIVEKITEKQTSLPIIVEQELPSQKTEIPIDIPALIHYDDELTNVAVEAKPDKDVIDRGTELLSKSDTLMNQEADGSENIEEPVVMQPKTLDDIKDTGRAGVDLYKCGYVACNFSVDTPQALKLHIKNDCLYVNDKREVSCPHCNKRFVKIGYLLEHYKLHGLKRFGCSLCKYRCAMAYQAVNHMKKHKVNSTKMVPADPANPSEDGLFIIQSLKQPLFRIGTKKGLKINSKNLLSREKVSFSPSEIESLPRQAIYNREVQCAVCPYKTKVRTNIVRHLQLHLKDETVPESGPVNPVPCLDKKERMFDKMVNLASSSHQNGRMGGMATKETLSPSELEALPKYVPEHQRYVCSVPECNYLTVDETMLRCHLKALHLEEQYFRCPHCPTPVSKNELQSIPFDKMGVHLKMHDTRLYKCSHCNYHHYHRYVVERHLTDKHAEKRPFVKVIREIENTETTNQQQPVPQEEVEDGPADKDGNYWKCNVCDYKCVYKHEMVAHAISAHNEKAQFKCCTCPFKTTSRMSLDQHINSKHMKDEDVDFTMVFERIKGPKKVVESSEQTAAAVMPPDEPFDTTPLWRRDMPRIRHIRGILLEDETETQKTPAASEPLVKAAKRKSDAETAAKPSKLVKTKSMPLEGTSLADSVTLEMKLQSAKGIRIDYASLDFGKPNGSLYVCPLCPNFKSALRREMRDHLFTDLKYWRWYCKSCGLFGVSQATVTKHIQKEHKNDKNDIVAFEANNKIETWVNGCLRKQYALMRGITEDMLDLPQTKPSKLAPTFSPKSPGGAGESSKSVLSPIKLPPTITLEENDMLSSKTTSPVTPSTPKKLDLTDKLSSIEDDMNLEDDDDDDEDDDDDDEDALVIDNKDDEIENPQDANSPTTSTAPSTKPTGKGKGKEKSFICPHCNTKFSRCVGFKLHIQLKHLKRRYSCPYCDKNINSEIMMVEHIQNKHKGRPEEVIENTDAGGPELTDEFWEKEYGIVKPAKTKKRKRGSEVTPEKPEIPDICRLCGFTAINSGGLKAHMRAHAKQHTLKCVYCSFTANSTTDVWQHSELNHPLSEWKAEKISTPGTSGKPELLVYKGGNADEDYSKDIEEEGLDDTPMMYGCYYCTLRSSSLVAMKIHWNNIHNMGNPNSKVKTGVPFKYKELPTKIMPKQKLLKCGYCFKLGGLNQLKIHVKARHEDLPFKAVEAIDRSHDIWTCEWCGERMENREKNSHHNMFHSHLPNYFKKVADLPMSKRGYCCPVCEYIAVNMSKMKKHVSKHYDKYRCKRCRACFDSIASATQHSTAVHPGLSANIEGYVSNINQLMAGVSETDFTDFSLSTAPDVRPPSNDIFRNLGVAKKSTTKQIVIKNPVASSIKAVARKSTNPLPRYPPGVVFGIGDVDSDVDSISSTSSSMSGFSFYGLPKQPIDMLNLNTTMSVGGVQMKVKCVTLAQIMNIEPRVLIRGTDIVDLKKFKKQKYSNLPSSSSST